MAFRWGDAEEDEDVEDVLPPKQVIGPDHKGIKTKIEWRRSEETGRRVKVTTILRVKKKKLNPAVSHRRQLKKFGDAEGQSAADNYTVVSVEEIHLEKPRADGAAPKENADALAALNPNAALIVCRACGKKGDHWTSKCPMKDFLGNKTLDGKPTGEEESASSSSGLPSGPKTSSYVPPNQRPGMKKEGEGYRHSSRDDSNSIRVTNLSEDTREQDLVELFRPFGNISRTYVAFDRETGLSRGFAFINFVNREDAVRAIKKLDGYGYDNLILRVEWATPREK